MKKIKLTRKYIIKALETEPLHYGAFIQKKNGSTSGFKVNDPNCRVCAVGAILRNKFGNIDCTIFNDKCYYACEDDPIAEDVLAKIREGNYLSGLSTFFENLCSDGERLPIIRRKCIGFVNAYFPDSFIIKV